MGKYLKTRTKTRTKTNKRSKTNKTRRTNKRRSKRRRTSKRRGGGGKSEEEIIDELKSKGKYEEWVKLGRYFGITSDIPDTLYMQDDPAKYYNVDGKIVDVAIIDKNYRTEPHLNNVAVFGQFYEKDPAHVAQGTYKIVNSNEPLTTTGLATCTGLTMLIGDKKFMTHLDATTPVSSIIDKIREVISEQRADPNDLKPHIYTGNLESELTLQKAKDICSAVKIPEKNYIIEQVCMIDIVEAPTKYISKKRPLDDNEYKEDLNGVKFGKYDDGDNYVYKPNNIYDHDDYAMADDFDYGS
jgi:hypothetical protein